MIKPQLQLMAVPTDPWSLSHFKYLIELTHSCAKPYLVAAFPLKLLYRRRYTSGAEAVVGLCWSMFLMFEEVMRNLHSAFQMADAVSSSPCLEVSNSTLFITLVNLAPVESFLQLETWEIAGNIIHFSFTIMPGK